MMNAFEHMAAALQAPGQAQRVVRRPAPAKVVVRKSSYAPRGETRTSRLLDYLRVHPGASAAELAAAAELPASDAVNALLQKYLRVGIVEMTLHSSRDRRKQRGRYTLVRDPSLYASLAAERKRNGPAQERQR